MARSYHRARRHVSPCRNSSTVESDEPGPCSGLRSRTADLVKGRDLAGPSPRHDLAVDRGDFDPVEDTLVRLDEVLVAELIDLGLGRLLHPLSIDGLPDLRRRLFG